MSNCMGYMTEMMVMDCECGRVSAENHRRDEFVTIDWAQEQRCVRCGEWTKRWGIVPEGWIAIWEVDEIGQLLN